jgi:hypothetical protein
MPDSYNYAHFELDDEEMEHFDAFPSFMHVGEPAPEGTLIDAHTEERVALASLWKRHHLVMEFGSFT